MRRLNILYLDHSHDFSGGQKSLVSLLELLDRRKFNPVAVVDEKAVMLKNELKRLSIHYTEAPFHSLSYYRIPQFLRLFRLLRSVIKQKEIDIVHTNTFMTGLIMSVFKFFLGKPFIFRARLAIEHHHHGIIDRIIYSRADCTLANSNYVQKTFEDKFGKNRKIQTIYNPLVFEESPLTFSRPGEFIFGIIGRIEPIKRHLDVVEAAEILANKKVPFKIKIIGTPSKGDNGQYYQQVLTAIREKNLEDYFQWTGFIANTRELTQQIDVCISCTIGEALSRSIFECQYYGTLVLASDSGGNRELIKDGNTGFLFHPAKAEDLALKMQCLIENKNRIDLDGIKKQARAQTLSLFSPDQTVRKEESEYIKLTGRKKIT